MYLFALFPLSPVTLPFLLCLCCAALHQFTHPTQNICNCSCNPTAQPFEEEDEEIKERKRDSQSWVFFLFFIFFSSKTFSLFFSYYFTLFHLHLWSCAALSYFLFLLPTVGLSASAFDPSCSHCSHWVCGVGGVSACCILFRLAVWLTAIFSFLVGCTGFGPVQMSPKPEPLDTSSSAVQREHHPISHSSIQSLPIPAASNSRFGASLPALQDPRCVLSLSRCFSLSFYLHTLPICHNPPINLTTQPAHDHTLYSPSHSLMPSLFAVSSPVGFSITRLSVPPQSCLFPPLDEADDDPFLVDTQLLAVLVTTLPVPHLLLLQSPTRHSQTSSNLLPILRVPHLLPFHLTP